MKKLKIFLSLLLILSALIACFTGCDSSGGDDETGDADTDESITEAETIDPNAEVLDFIVGGATEFLISRPNSRDEEFAFNAYSEVKKLVKEYTGVNLEMSYEAIDGYEIVIGSKGRDEFSEFEKTYRSRDYFMGVVGKKLVFYAQSAAAMDDAVEDFEELLSEKVSKDKANIKFISTENVECVFATLKIAGSPIKDFSIVYNPNGRYSEELLALKISATLTEAIGQEIKIYKDTDASAKSLSNMIVIGKTAFSENVSAEGFEYHVEVKDDDVYLYAESIEGYEALLEGMMECISSGRKGDAATTFSGNADTSSAAEIKSDLSSDIRVIIHNILGNCDVNKYPVSYRTRSVAELLASYSPDVMGLQECSPNSRANSCDIVDILESYGYKEVPAQPTNSKKNNYTPLFYNPETVKVIEYGYDYLNGSQNDSGSKSITWAVFEVIATGEKFGACSTHFFYQSDAAAARVNNAKQLSARCKAIVDKYGCPVIAGGDLNTKIDSDAYRSLLSDGLKAIRDKADYANSARTHHAYPEFSSNDGYYSTFTAPTTDYTLSIDHVLVYNGDDLKFKNYYVVTENFALMSSDHCPIVVDFNFSK